MKKNTFESFLYSVVGVAAMFVIMAAVYFISGVVKARVDLTDEKLYTLSPGTRAIVQKLDTPVEIRFYCTQDSKDMPVALKTYAQRVEDLLREYRKAGKSNIELKKFDPKPDSDAEDSANMDGVEGQMLQTGDRIYLGLAISQLDAKVAIPFLSPDREKLLEYDISRAIARVTTPDKPVVGVMSSLQVFGEFNPMAMRMGQAAARSNPWVFISELQRDFEVRQIDALVEEIPADLKVLVVVHPKNLPVGTLFAIDQFVLGGGKLLAFVDPMSVADGRNNPQMNPLQTAQIGGSNLDPLTKAWGIEFDSNKVVADMNFVTRINRGNRTEAAPAILSLNSEALDGDDPVTGQTDNALMVFSGAFTGTPAEGLTKTVLIRSSKESQLVDRFMAELAGEQIAKDFAPSGIEYPLALRLTGRFKTAYPDGKPASAPVPHDDEEEHDDAAEQAQGGGLKESTAEGTVILVGDTDILFDQFSVQVQEIFGQRIVIPRNGNLNLVQSMVEQLAGDENLITVRGRATMNRPFTVVRTMQAQAEERYRNKIGELERSLQETQARLGELQRNKDTGQQFILSPEQQAELQRFQAKQVEVNKELRKERRNLRKEIDSLENRLKWVNIAGMPLLVAVSGVSLALFKRRRTGAR